MQKKPLVKPKSKKKSAKVKSIERKATALRKDLKLSGKKLKPGDMISKMNKLKVEALI